MATRGVFNGAINRDRRASLKAGGERGEGGRVSDAILFAGESFEK